MTAPPTAVILAAVRTRDDLGETGRNYPDIRTLLAYVEKCIDAARAPAAPVSAPAEPVAWRYRDSRGHWRYVGMPFSKGWTPGEIAGGHPLYTAAPLPEARAKPIPDVHSAKSSVGQSPARQTSKDQS